ALPGHVETGRRDVVFELVPRLGVAATKRRLDDRSCRVQETVVDAAVAVPAGAGPQHPRTRQRLHPTKVLTTEVVPGGPKCVHAHDLGASQALDDAGLIRSRGPLA